MAKDPVDGYREELQAEFKLRLEDEKRFLRIESRLKVLEDGRGQKAGEAGGETKLKVARIQSRPLVITAITGAVLGLIGLLIQIFKSVR